MITEKYKVTIAADSLDPNPSVQSFDSFYEADDFVQAFIDNAVQWRVDHSPYFVSEKELSDMREEELSLVKVELED